MNPAPSSQARIPIHGDKKGIQKDDIKQRARRTILDALQFGVTILKTHIDIDPNIGLKGIESALELRQDFNHTFT